MQISSFINNTFYSGSTTFIKNNPYTLEPLHQVQNCDLMGLVLAIKSANAAFSEYQISSYEQRTQLVLNIKSVLVLNSLNYAKLEALDQGLPLSFVLKNSIQNSINYIDEKINEINNFNHSELVQYSPVGVIAIITSWNLSLRIVLERLIPALLAGNAIIIKISSTSPVTAFILAEVLIAANVPLGLVQVIVTHELEVKKTLVSHPGIKAISFVGSSEQAQNLLPIITQNSLGVFKKFQISAGSKNTSVILTEPKSEYLQQMMESFLIGQGQLAWSSARLFILEKYENEWQEFLQSYLQNLKPAEDINDASVWTPTLKSESFSVFAQIKTQAYHDQAKLIETNYNLTNLQKNIYLPPIFTKDMSRCSTLQQDQIHAPFYILSTVKYAFDVFKYSNVSYFGYAAHLWGEDSKLNKIAPMLDVGLVTYNKSSVEQLGPVIGVKQSGMGQQDFQIFGAFFSNVKKISI